jgi:Fe-S-cluster containining protein
MSAKLKRQSNFFDLCSQCKSCCQGARPPTTPRRRKIIENFLKKQAIALENPFRRLAYTFPRENTEEYCIFYDMKTKRCLVHPVKPETCVAGPITFDINTKTQKIEWYLKTEKICQVAGRLHKDREALQKHLKSAKEEILRLVQELDSEALKAILKIEEPETFKVDEDRVQKEILYKLADDLQIDSPYRFRSRLNSSR